MVVVRELLLLRVYRSAMWTSEYVFQGSKREVVSINVVQLSQEIRLYTTIVKS